MPNNAEELGKKIKEIRKSLGLNQSEFANKINATVPAVSNWENGRNMPNDERLKNIAKLANISIIKLLSGEDNSKQIAMKEHILELSHTNRRLMKLSNKEVTEIMNVQEASIQAIVDLYNSLFPDTRID